MKAVILAAASLMLSAGIAPAASTFTVEPAVAADKKAVFATVESLEVVPARVRTGGTIVSLSLKGAITSSAGRFWRRSATTS